MKQIPVEASKSYCVTIGKNLLSQLGETVCSVTAAKKVCIVSDTQVWPLYGETVCESLKRAQLEVIHFVFSAGESSKNPQNYLELLNFLSENRLSRKDCLIALGGGVVGDLTGFAAATYLRGIAYLQVPTTLLAMVDSSVGGKTGIDLPGGKNLCGAFWQPAAVVCDLNTLDTLPEEIFRDGCAEVIKYAVLFDPALFSLLEENKFSFPREDVIARCITLKKDVVAGDEFDNGQRQLLNLGHTIGHAIEVCSDYAISHGRAVAMGMGIVARASHTPDAVRICRLLETFQLPTTTTFSGAQLYQAALSDKKQHAGSVQLILPRHIGQCEMVPTPNQQLQAFIEEGL